MSSPSDATIYAALSESSMFQDYQDAFEKSTGLRLSLHQPSDDHACLSSANFSGGGSFSALMASTSHPCEAGFALQEELEAGAQLEPKTLKGFAGLCETAVPVRVGEKLIAFLQTGGILLEVPSKRQFSKISQELLRLGSRIDLKQVEEAYFASRVISVEQYQSMVKLLAMFGAHLAACGSQLALQRSGGQNSAVMRARQIIDTGFREELAIGEVARQVNVSAGYFSLLFKKETGMNFVEYVARLRVEKAKGLLRIPNFRVSEAAFAVGFQSLSQFNRMFRRLAGVSPRVYRASQEEPAISRVLI